MVKSGGKTKDLGHKLEPKTSIRKSKKKVLNKKSRVYSLEDCFLKSLQKNTFFNRTLRKKKIFEKKIKRLRTQTSTKNFLKLNKKFKNQSNC